MVIAQERAEVSQEFRSFKKKNRSYHLFRDTEAMGRYISIFHDTHRYYQFKFGNTGIQLL